MVFPSIADYKDAIAVSESFATLTHLEPVAGHWGGVYFSSGNFAVVFKMRDTQTGKLYAVKCFTREQGRRAESLDSISRYLTTFQSPYVVPYTFLKDEIWVNDAEYPVLLMDWVEGVTLGEKVKMLCESRDTEGLHRLSVAFAKMALWLLAQDWAHGDLKHDNIMVRPDDSLVLVDYDGCFVPAMVRQKAREIGSPCYRHPQRTMADFDKHIDDFSILVIFLSLRALVEAPHLFIQYHNGENLVLTTADFDKNAPLINTLRQSTNNILRGSVALLDFALTLPVRPVFGLKEGVLMRFFEQFKKDLLSKKVVLVFEREGGWHKVSLEPLRLEVDRDIKELNLSGKNIKTVPAEIGQLTNLTVLNVSNNYQLTHLPAEIGNLIKLTKLSLGSNQLSYLPVEIGRLINLMELDLKGNQLVSLPKEIGQLTNLTNLYLWRNQLINLPVEIGQLSNLTCLHLDCSGFTHFTIEIEKLADLPKLKILILSSIQLTHLPTEIGKLTNLTILGLTGSKLTHLPTEIGKLTNLTELILLYNRLTHLPTEIGQLKNLRKLCLDGNPIIELPEEISQLNLDEFDSKHLPIKNKTMTLIFDRENDKPLRLEIDKNIEKLDLAYKKITKLPSEIGQLKNLTGLKLMGNHITHLPIEIGQLSNLVDLDLIGNQLTHLPIEIRQLTNLTCLFLNGLKLTHLAKEIKKLAGLPKLTELFLGSMDIICLPVEIGLLTNLAKLCLSGSQLTYLPAEIGKLTNLTILVLSDNQIIHWPAEIGCLTNLTELSLWGNKLAYLPAEIGQLTNLTNLYLSSNQLTHLPTEIGRLTNLTDLYLDNNQLTHLPAEIGRLTNLRELDLSGNQFSNQEKERIEALLPKCRISWY